MSYSSLILLQFIFAQRGLASILQPIFSSVWFWPDDKCMLILYFQGEMHLALVSISHRVLVLNMRLGFSCECVVQIIMLWSQTKELLKMFSVFCRVLLKHYVPFCQVIKYHLYSPPYIDFIMTSICSWQLFRSRIFILSINILIFSSL